MKLEAATVAQLTAKNARLPNTAKPVSQDSILYEIRI